MISLAMGAAVAPPVPLLVGERDGDGDLGVLRRARRR